MSRKRRYQDPYRGYDRTTSKAAISAALHVEYEEMVADGVEPGLVGLMAEVSERPEQIGAGSTPVVDAMPPTMMTAVHGLGHLLSLFRD